MPTMGQIIQWCNNNDGFTSAILSVIGLGLSVIAIWVSISTARLPYRKKITVQMNTVYGVFDVPGLYDQLPVIALAATITNIGNRPIYVEYLGFSILENGKFLRMYPRGSELRSNFSLAPSEVVKNKYDCKILLDSLSKQDPKSKLYVLAIDTEGKEYRKKIGTVEELLKKFIQEENASQIR